MTANLVYVVSVISDDITFILGVFKTYDEAKEYEECFNPPVDSHAYFSIDVVPYFLNDACKT